MGRPSSSDLKVLQAVAQGETRSLGLTTKELWTCLKRVMGKYGVRTVAAAIVVAIGKKDLPRPTTPTLLAPLNQEWEWRFLQLTAQGLSRRERAEELSIGRSQYLTLVASITRKMGAHSLEHAVYLACGWESLDHSQQPRSPRPRELDALIATTQAETLEEAASIAGTTTGNFKNLIKNARDRLWADTTPQAVARAIRMDLIPVEPATPRYPLEKFDRFILRALASGMRNADIAGAAGLSSYLQAEKLTRATLDRLGTRSRPRAVLLGFQYGILE